MPAHSFGDPAKIFEAVTPSDTVNFTGGRCNFIYVGVAGDVVAICNGVAVTFKALANGWHPIVCTRINLTSTTATNMLACYIE
jgi:nickel-dependent lactate racemase